MKDDGPGNSNRGTGNGEQGTASPEIPANCPPPLDRAPLAYENSTFLNSADGRLIRIVAEYAEPLARFRREQIQDTVVFFGSARFQSRDAAQKMLRGLKGDGDPGSDQQKLLKSAQAGVDMARYYEDARRLAYLLTDWSIK